MDVAEPGTTGWRFASPVRKLVTFFERSRDGWKAKYHELKRQRKLDQHHVRAVEKSREQWRQKAEAAEFEVQRLAAEVAEFKKKQALRRSNSGHGSKPSVRLRPVIHTASD